jgi:hypothetical protein
VKVRLIAMARSREATSICSEVLLIAGPSRSHHHTAAGCYDTRADKMAIATVIGVGVIAPAVIIAIVRKSRTHAHANRTKLNARTAGIRAYKHLRAGRCRNHKRSSGNQTEYKFIHRILQCFFDLILHI